MKQYIKPELELVDFSVNEAVMGNDVTSGDLEED